MREKFTPLPEPTAFAHALIVSHWPISPAGGAKVFICRIGGPSTGGWPYHHQRVTWLCRSPFGPIKLFENYSAGPDKYAVFLLRTKDQRSWLVRGLLCGMSRVRFPGVTSNPCFDFFPFRIALSSFKYPWNGKTRHWWRGKGGRGKMSAPSASGLSVRSLFELPT